MAFRSDSMRDSWGYKVSGWGAADSRRGLRRDVSTPKPTEGAEPEAGSSLHTREEPATPALH